MKAECCVCHRPQVRTHCEVVKLTEEEKVSVEKMGYKPAPSELVYCKPCWGILSDKQQGAQLLRGLVEQTLRKAGVSNAENKASSFHERLLAKVKS